MTEAAKELIERWEKQAESFARKAKDIDYSGGDSSFCHTKEILCDEHIANFRRALPAIEANIRREVEEELRKPGLCEKHPKIFEVVSAECGLPLYCGWCNAVSSARDSMVDKMACGHERACGWPELGHCTACDAVRLAEEVALREAAGHFPYGNHAWVSHCLCGWKPTGDWPHGNIQWEQHILSLSKSGPLLAAHDNELMRLKEIGVIEHVKGGWHDGCRCDPCIFVRETVTAHDAKVVEAAERLFIAELEGRMSMGVPDVSAAIASIRERQHMATLRAAAKAVNHLPVYITAIIQRQFSVDAVLALPMPPLAADDEKEEVGS